MNNKFKTILTVVLALVMSACFTCFVACGYTQCNHNYVDGVCTVCGKSEPASATYTVTFDLNGGTGETSAITLREGDTVTVPELTVTKDGFDFLGWKYNGKTYVANDTFLMPKENVTMVAAWEKQVVKYKIIFDLNGGEGTAPTVEDQVAGATVTIPETTVTREYFEFVGWRYETKVESKTLKAGDTFIMGGKEVTLRAVWNQLDPVFSQESFTYDRLGAGVCELPLNLQGSNLYVVEINDVAVASKDFSYNTEKKCLVLSEEYVMTLAIGEHSVKAITDGDGEAALCTLTIENSVVTSFDEQTFKTVNVAKEAGATFTVDYNGTTVVSLKMGDETVAATDYEVGENTLTVKSSLLRKYMGKLNFTVALSNHDSYSFTVSNNVIFYTDYDVTTIHDTKIDLTGHNSLYQYCSAESIAIVDGPEGMSGKVLRFIPSDKDNKYDVHGVYTLKGHNSTYLWYDAKFNNDKQYVVSFDYMTENSANGGDFYFKVDTKVGSGKTYNLLLGESNDGKLHHYEAVVDGADIAGGILVNARVLGATLYFDNFSVIEVDETPAFTVTTDAAMGSDYVVGFDAKGWDYEALLDGKSVEVSIDSEAKTMTIAKADLADLTCGKHTIAVKTAFVTISAEFTLVDNRVCEITESTKQVYYGKGDVKVAGNFDTSLSVASVTRKGSDTAWDKTVSNLKTSYVTVEKDGLLLSETLINKLYKDTVITVTFDNGKNVAFTLESSTRYFSDYDETNVFISIAGNSVICQDRSMIEVVDVDGNHMLKYTPSNATQGHSKNAINGKGDDNFCFTVCNKNNDTTNWYDWNPTINAKLKVFFDYKVVLGEKTESYYKFDWQDIKGNWYTYKLSGEGHFEVEIEEALLTLFGIRCPASSADKVEGTYLLIDSIGFCEYEKEEGSILTENTKKVYYGGIDVKVAGSFDTNRTVAAVMRKGFDTGWDKKVSDLKTSYVTIESDGLVLSKDLINKLYGTTNLTVKFDNGEYFKVVLESNIRYFSDYDETNVFVNEGGNKPFHQDGNMLEVVDVDGNHMLKYTPSNAVLGHSKNALTGGGDNFVVSVDNRNRGNYNWYNWAPNKESELIIFFDYEVVLGDKTVSYYKFDWQDVNGTWHATTLSDKGHFELKVKESELAHFGIRCPVSSADMVEGTYLLIDSIGFGECKAE